MNQGQMSTVFFILAICAVALCCHCFRCLCECMFRWIDYWHEVSYERAMRERMEQRGTVIHPMPIPLSFPKQHKSTKIIPADKYIVFLNPDGHKMCLGLPQEYSNV